MTSGRTSTAERLTPSVCQSISRHRRPEASASRWRDVTGDASVYYEKKAVRRFHGFCLLASVALLACGEEGGGGAQAAGAGGSSVSATSGASTSATAGSGGAASGTGGADIGDGGMGGAGAGGAGDGGAGDGGAGAGAGGAGGSPLPPITDYAAEGPFATTVERSSGPSGNHTIFRPERLGENGFLHAPIIFGPGINTQVTSYTALLSSFASHGFVVVGANLLTGGPNAPNNRAAMLEGLDWIIAQNSKAGSIYEGKLDVEHAVSMGYSVGGTAAVELGGHEAVATVVSIHGHVATAALHGPMLQTSGTQDTVGLPMQQKTYDMSQTQTFLATVMGADHGYITRDVGGVQRPAIVAWLRYWIYNDTGGKHYFYGDDCVMCTSPWVNPQRKNWE
ncbi:dienelactone hydrolase family protein [Sorangium sp. So ce375]|uniref:poly(ethylene terephthalate) hydrolase family protein n=1 Tax=Sorangium sp. So ce375 TaxID=3133306 RepID=UPI003F5C9BAA